VNQDLDNDKGLCTYLFLWDTAVMCERAIYHTIPYSFNNVADIRSLQQYCSIEHCQSGRTKVYDS